MTRRMLMSASLAGLSSPFLEGCSTGSGTYDDVLADMLRPLTDTPDIAELVRYATLAANNHNAQP
jgi:hypothetical protein